VKPGPGRWLRLAGDGSFRPSPPEINVSGSVRCDPGRRGAAKQTNQSQRTRLGTENGPAFGHRWATTCPTWSCTIRDFPTSCLPRDSRQSHVLSPFAGTFSLRKPQQGT
jgi:hypothetical protein